MTLFLWIHFVVYAGAAVFGLLRLALADFPVYREPRTSSDTALGLMINLAFGFWTLALLNLL